VGWRLETGAALGIADELVPLRVWTRELGQRAHEREGEARSTEGVAIAAKPRWDLGFGLPVLAEDDDRLEF
jgi:hypothetical protein